MEVGESAVKKLAGYHWPGNIRELRNVLERSVLLTEGKELTADDFQFEARTSSAVPAYDSKATLDEIERVHVQIAMDEEGSVEKAAKRLGIPKSTLYQKLKVMKTSGSA